MTNIIDFESARKAKELKKFHETLDQTGRPPLIFKNSPRAKVWLQKLTPPFFDTQLHASVPCQKITKSTRRDLVDKGFLIFRFHPGIDEGSASGKNLSACFFINAYSFHKMYNPVAETSAPNIRNIFYKAAWENLAPDREAKPVLYRRNIHSLEKSIHTGIYNSLPAESRFEVNAGDYVATFSDGAIERIEPFEAQLRLRRLGKNGEFLPIEGP